MRPKKIWLLLVVLSAAAPVPAYEYEPSPVGPTDSSASKERTAVCPSGSVAIGGGFSITEESQLLITASLPFLSGPTPIGWRVRANEAVPTSALWNLTGNAVCGVVADIEVVSGNSLVVNAGFVTAQAICPPDTVAIGGGGEVTGGFSGKTLFASEPLPVLSEDGEVPIGWQAGASEIVDSDDFFGVTVYAICAPPLPDFASYATRTPRSTDPYKDLFAECPVDLLPIGLGYAAPGFNTDVRMTRSIPTQAGDDVLWQATAWDPADDDNWILRTYAMCAPEPSALLLHVGALGALVVLARRAS